MSARVLLFADFGKGPKVKGKCEWHVWDTMLKRPLPKPILYVSPVARAAQRTALAWWIVECEDAAAGRRVIERSRQITERVYSGVKLLGRIIENGTNGGAR